MSDTFPVICVVVEKMIEWGFICMLGWLVGFVYFAIDYSFCGRVNRHILFF